MGTSTAANLTEQRYYPLDPQVMADPYEEYQRVREMGPLCWVAPAALGVTRFDDIGKLIKDGRIVSSFPKDDPRFTLDSGPAAELSQRILLTRETKNHQRLRGLIAPAFTPKRVAHVQDRIAQKVASIYARAAEQGEFDAVADLGLPLTVAVVSELLGIPDDARDEIGQRAALLSRAFTPFAMPEDNREQARDALVWLRKLVHALLLERLDDPAEDLLTEMAKALKTSDEFSVEELVDNAVFVVFTGYETTSSLIGTGFSLLLEHADARRTLWQNPDLVKSAIQEMLRYDAPSQFAAGIAQERVEFYQHVIRPGRVVFFMLGSGNRDPRKFAHPDRFDITRNPNPHLSFGTGAHRCVGAALGLMESEIVFRKLVETFKDMQPVGGRIRQPNPSIRSYKQVPVSIIKR